MPPAMHEKVGTSVALMHMEAMHKDISAFAAMMHREGSTSMDAETGKVPLMDKRTRNVLLRPLEGKICIADSCSCGTRTRRLPCITTSVPSVIVITAPHNIGIRHGATSICRRRGCGRRSKFNSRSLYLYLFHLFLFHPFLGYCLLSICRRIA
jgi:hypothetical protein